MSNLSRTMLERPVHGNFTAMIAHDKGWWIGFIEELPGVNAQEKTRGELVKSLKIALRDILKVNREIALESAPRKYVEEAIAL